MLIVQYEGLSLRADLSDTEGIAAHGPFGGAVGRGGCAWFQAICGSNVDDIALLALNHGSAQVLDEPLRS